MTERFTSELAVISRLVTQRTKARHQKMVRWGWTAVVAGVVYTMDADDFFKKKEQEILGLDDKSYQNPGLTVEPSQSITPRQYSSRYNHSQRY